VGASRCCVRGGWSTSVSAAIPPFTRTPTSFSPTANIHPAAFSWLVFPPVCLLVAGLTVPCLLPLLLSSPALALFDSFAFPVPANNCLLFPEAPCSTQTLSSPKRYSTVAACAAQTANTGWNRVLWPKCGSQRTSAN
jgi:hypothetical protein